MPFELAGEHGFACNGWKNQLTPSRIEKWSTRSSAAFAHAQSATCGTTIESTALDNYVLATCRMAGWLAGWLVVWIDKYNWHV